MTTPVRTPGLRGKLPAKPSGLRFVHEYAVEPLPAPKYPIDVTGGIAADAWGMDGNGPDPTCTVAPDGVGDCTFAARQHAKQAKSAVYKQAETWETSNEIVEEYLAYDHGQDDGAVISDLLLSWYDDGKILGFAPVDHSSVEAVDAAMQAFGGIYVGVNLTDDADDLFSEGEPWTVADGQQPDPADGHCIVGVKATRDGRTYVTWGAEQEATAPWSAACVTEVYVLITTEDEAAKVRMPALTADIEALHGMGAATAAPAPQPEPAKGNIVLASLGKVEAAIRADWEKLDGEARRDAEEALADLKAKLASVGPAAQELEAELLKAVETAEPAVLAAVQAAIVKFLEAVAPELAESRGGTGM